MINVPISVSAQDAVPVHVFPSGTPFSLDGAVRYDVEQNLTNSEQAQARDNISAAEVITDTVSGETASVSDGAGGMDARSLVVNIEPIQNLHGYANPWPAGGGKNKCSVNSLSVGGSNPRTTRIAIAEIPAGSYYVSFTKDGTAESNIGIQFLNASAQNIASLSTLPTVAGGGTVTLSESAVYLYGYMGQTEYNNGQTLTLSNIQVESGSLKTAFAPYSNICPISGRTGANVYHTGKNLANMFSDGKVPSVSTGALVNANGYRSDFIPFEGNAAFAFSERSGAQIYVMYYDGDKRFLSYTFGTFKISNTSPANTAYVMLRKDNNTAPTDAQLEYGTATAYSPYVCTTYPVPLGQTVYGGTLDVTTGVLTVDRAIVDLGTLSWNASTRETTYKIFSTYGIADVIKDTINNWTVPANFICSQYKTVTFNEAYAGNTDAVISVAKGNHSINLVDSNFAFYSTTEVATALSGVQLCYELATPITYQLTPTEVKMLLGTNNIFSDGGSVLLTYPCDTKLYIEKLTQPSEDDMIANANIANDTYFMVGNNLYLSTAAIAAGNTIQVGVNCVSVSLPDALNALKS